MAERVHFQRLFEDDVQFSASRSSGPGGQNVNKRSTKAELTLLIWAARWLTEGQKISIIQYLSKNQPAMLFGERNNEYIIITSSSTRSLDKNRLDAEAKLKRLIEICLHKPKVRKKTTPTRGAIERRLQSKRKDSLKKSLRKAKLD